MTTTGNDAPAMSMADANAALTATGQLFEMEELDIRGVPTRTWKNAAALAPGHHSSLSLGHGDAVFLVYEDERTTFAERLPESPAPWRTVLRARGRGRAGRPRRRHHHAHATSPSGPWRSGAPRWPVPSWSR